MRKVGQRWLIAARSEWMERLPPGSDLWSRATTHDHAVDPEQDDGANERRDESGALALPVPASSTTDEGCDERAGNADEDRDDDSTGSFPGMMSFASAPTISPMMIAQSTNPSALPVNGAEAGADFGWPCTERTARTSTRGMSGRAAMFRAQPRREGSQRRSSLRGRAPRRRMARGERAWSSDSRAEAGRKVRFLNVTAGASPTHQPAIQQRERNTTMKIERSGSQSSVKGPSDWFTGTVRIESSVRRQCTGARCRQRRHL